MPTMKRLNDFFRMDFTRPKWLEIKRNVLISGSLEVTGGVEAAGGLQFVATNDLLPDASEKVPGTTYLVLAHSEYQGAPAIVESSGVVWNTLTVYVPAEESSTEGVWQVPWSFVHEDVKSAISDLEELQNSVNRVVHGDVWYQADKQGISMYDALHYAWESESPEVVLRNPNEDLSEFVYTLGKLTALEDKSGKKIYFDTNVKLSPGEYTGDPALAESLYRDHVDANAVLTFINCNDLLIYGPGAIDAMNIPSNIPFKGRGYRDITITGNTGTRSYDFTATGEDTPTTLTFTWNTSTTQTAADFVAANSAFFATKGMLISSVGAVVTVVGKGESTGTWTLQGGATLTATLGSNYYRGTDNPAQPGGAGVDTMFRSHHCLGFRDCTNVVVSEVQLMRGWWGITANGCTDFTWYKSKYDSEDEANEGPRRETSPGSGLYQGETYSSGMSCTECTGVYVYRCYAKGVSEFLDPNPDNFYITVVDCSAENIYEGAIETSGVEFIFIRGFRGKNCRNVLELSPYVGGTANGEVTGFFAEYTSDAPDWLMNGTDLRLPRQIIPLVVNAEFRVQGSVQLWDNVDYVNMAALTVFTSGQTTYADGRFDIDLRVRAAATSPFMGLQNPELQYYYGRRGEIVYQNGGRLRLDYQGPVAAGAPLVVTDGGIVDVLSAINLTPSATTVIEAHGITKVRWNVSRSSGFDNDLVATVGAKVDPLYPTETASTIPHLNDDVYFAWYEDLDNFYAHDEQIIAGIPYYGRARIVGSQDVGPRAVDNGGVGVYRLNEGVRWDTLTGAQVPTWLGKIGWNQFRVTMLVRLGVGAGWASGVRRLYGHGGGGTPIKINVLFDGQIQVTTTGNGGSENSAAGAVTIDGTTFHVISVVIDGTSLDIRCKPIGGSVTEWNHTIVALNSAGTGSGYNGVTTWGSRQNGTEDANGVLDMPAFIISDGATGVSDARRDADEAFLESMAQVVI